MKLLVLALAVASSASAMASSSTVYNSWMGKTFNGGSTQSFKSCGDFGRTMTKSEVERLEGNGLCSKLFESNANSKQVVDEHGKAWFVTKARYSNSCSMSPNGSRTNASLCTYNGNAPSANRALLFSGSNFTGTEILGGEPIVTLSLNGSATSNSKSANAHIQSAKVGRDMVLTAYSLPNFGGEKQALTGNITKAPFVIKSYVVEPKAIEPSPPPEKTGNTHSFWLGGTSKQSNCDDYGRILKKSEVDNAANLCEGVPAISGYWKFIDDNGAFWSMVGPPASQCELTPGSSAEYPMLCAYNGVAPVEGQAYLFPATEFKGNTPWGGKPVVGTINDQVESTSIRSFKVGAGLHLKAYSEANFAGKEELFIAGSLVEYAPFEIKSYKIVSTLNGQVAFDFEYDRQDEGFSCLTLKANGKTEKICSNDPEDKVSKILTDLPKKAGTMNIAIYLDDYEASGQYPYPTTGAVYIDHDADGDLTISSRHYMPEGLTVEQTTKNLLSFTRH